MSADTVLNILAVAAAMLAGGILFADWPRQRFGRTVTLYDGPDTREKATVLDKWEVIIDDERNPDFKGLEEFLEWGASYRLTIEKV
jgi:hypothetical protein